MIDINLSKYLNDYPYKNNLRIMFLREGEGIYRFGTKRVYIKIDKANIIKVRVGGGYMDIQDFLNTYTF